MSDATLPTRPPWWRDVRVLRIVAQVAFALAVAGFLYYLWFNLLTNLTRQGIGTNFDYLDQSAGIRITGSDFLPGQSNLEALQVAVKNTALIALVGIVLTTLLGTLIGVMRLSSNWLVARSAALYVETLRNVPVLIIIIFWSSAVILKLPRIENAIEWGQAFTLSNRGLWVPWLVGRETVAAYLWILTAGAVAAALVWRWRTRHNERTGQPHHRVLWALGVLALTAAAGYLGTGAPFTVTFPERTGLTIVGGFRMTPEYAALLVALVLYTASHVAEIVRGSILSVHRGQTEAATAVGLSPFQRLRFVILPQAFRVAVPPVANQYLNLTKNSSLAVAIGYPELTSITRQIIGNGHPAPQNIAVLMGVYLVFSLSISTVMNVVNRRLQLVER